MKTVITGAGGQLGRALQDGLASHEIVALDHAALDITNRDAVRAAIFTAGPDVVIHPAAWTDTVGCERDPERAILVNAEGARNVAEAARDAGAAMLHISTNEVFDGEKRTPYAEDDRTTAINAYGRSKLAGEEAVAKKAAKKSPIGFLGARPRTVNERPRPCRNVSGLPGLDQTKSLRVGKICNGCMTRRAPRSCPG